MHYFVHIPKTAGTSFRLSAERHFGAQRIVYDYGAHSPVTSPCIRTALYEPERPDRKKLAELWAGRDLALVAGHKSLKRFGPMVGLQRTLTFFREPLERCFSEYQHFQREHGFRGTFREFYAKRTNRQSRSLDGLPIQALGFVGITERYRDSLRLLNALEGWKLTYRKTNRAGWLAPGVASVSAEDREHFSRLNARDLACYEAAVRLLDERLALQARGLPWVHGSCERDEAGRIHGWAWWASAGNAEPVVLQLWLDGRCRETVSTGEHDIILARSGAPGAGHVGFCFQQVTGATENPVVQVRATGQVLSLVDTGSGQR